ncbi:unnamed protein product, partial [Effrenium voratum]
VGDFMLVLRDALIKLGIYQPDKGLVEATVGAFLARHFGPHWDKYQSPYGWAIEFQQEDML